MISIKYLYLPIDIYKEYIFIYLDIKDILNLSICNKFMYKIYQENYIWNSIILRDFKKTYNKDNANKQYILLRKYHGIIDRVPKHYIRYSEILKLALIDPLSIKVKYSTTPLRTVAEAMKIFIYMLDYDQVYRLVLDYMMKYFGELCHELI